MSDSIVKDSLIPQSQPELIPSPLWKEAGRAADAAAARNVFQHFPLKLRLADYSSWKKYEPPGWGGHPDGSYAYYKRDPTKLRLSDPSGVQIPSPISSGNHLFQAKSFTTFPVNPRNSLENSLTGYFFSG